MSQSLPPDIPGDPGGITALGAAMSSAAGEIAAVRQQLATTGLDSWLSTANHAYQGALTEHLYPHLGTAEQMLDEIGGQLRAYADRLDEYQRAHQQYKAQVEEAQGRQAAARAQSVHSYGLLAGLEHSVTKVAATTLYDAEHAADNLAHDVEKIGEEIGSLLKQAWDNFERYADDAEHVAVSVGDAVADVRGVVFGAVGKVVGTIGSVELMAGSALFGVAKGIGQVAVDGYDFIKNAGYRTGGDLYDLIQHPTSFRNWMDFTRDLTEDAGIVLGGVALVLGGAELAGGIAAVGEVGLDAEAIGTVADAGAAFGDVDGLGLAAAVDREGVQLGFDFLKAGKYAAYTRAAADVGSEADSVYRVVTGRESIKQGASDIIDDTYDAVTGIATARIADGHPQISDAHPILGEAAKMVEDIATPAVTSGVDRAVQAGDDALKRLPLRLSVPAPAALFA